MVSINMLQLAPLLAAAGLVLAAVALVPKALPARVRVRRRTRR